MPCELAVCRANLAKKCEAHGFGGMGAGWWIEQGDTSIDFDVQSLLELLDLLPEAPEVPKPDVSGDDD